MLVLLTGSVIADIAGTDKFRSNYPFLAVVATALNLLFELRARFTMELGDDFGSPRHSRNAVKPRYRPNFLVQFAFPFLVYVLWLVVRFVTLSLAPASRSSKRFLLALDIARVEAARIRARSQAKSSFMYQVTFARKLNAIAGQGVDKNDIRNIK